jgi:DNA-binding transcriptional LysR family regulator
VVNGHLEKDIAALRGIVSDRLRQMEVFVAVAEAAGFAPAARRLGLSPPAVTRAIAALEAELGTRLLRRTTRIVRLTEAGTGYLQDCRRILAEIEQAASRAAGVRGVLRGGLSVTASVMFGRMHVLPALLAFLDLHPEMVARALLLDRIVDLIEEGVDVAVRIAELPDSSLKAVRIGQVRRVICASPAFLEAHGVPDTPSELNQLEAVLVSSGEGPSPWVFGSGRSARTIRPVGRLTVSSVEAAIAAAKAGRGLVRAMSYQVTQAVQEGALQLLLEDHEPPPIPIHLVHDGAARGPVRAFVDFAVDELGRKHF